VAMTGHVSQSLEKALKDAAAPPEGEESSSSSDEEGETPSGTSRSDLGASRSDLGTSRSDLGASRSDLGASYSDLLAVQDGEEGEEGESSSSSSEGEEDDEGDEGTTPADEPPATKTGVDDAAAGKKASVLRSPMDLGKTTGELMKGLGGSLLNMGGLRFGKSTSAAPAAAPAAAPTVAPAATPDAAVAALRKQSSATSAMASARHVPSSLSRRSSIDSQVGLGLGRRVRVRAWG